MQGEEPLADADSAAPTKPGFVPLAIETLLQLWKKQDPEREQYRVYFSLFELYCDKLRDLIQDVPLEKARRDLPGSRYNEGGSRNSISTAFGSSTTQFGSTFGSTFGGSFGGCLLRGSLGEGEVVANTRYVQVDDLPVQMNAMGEETVAKLEKIPMTCLEDFRLVYEERIKLRRTGATSLNEKSSRSHCCIEVSVEKVESEKGAEVAGRKSLARRPAMTRHERPVEKQVGRLFMVDLAGCEDNRETDNRGPRIEESKRINSTYLSLVKVCCNKVKHFPRSGSMNHGGRRGEVGMTRRRGGGGGRGIP